ncbi:protein SNORC-like [Cyprinus carpio]|uniref:Protein SNORC-like n=2 Tax=Cyprinus carpio TaxID=7962 RepID=A0A9Q9VJG7_CYPCA|nr:protein SNORC-like [Cyprinus carpio]
MITKSNREKKHPGLLMDMKAWCCRSGKTHLSGCEEGGQLPEELTKHSRVQPGTMGICSNYSGLSRLVFIGALAICMAFVQSETVDDSSPTLQNDNQDTLSGAGGFDVTTKVPLQDPKENTFTSDYDHTPSITLDEEEVVLGPGAITAIVIAVFLGASVLLALIVITLRKFTAS